MSEKLAEVLKAALSLTEGERLELADLLADLLADSVVPPPGPSYPDFPAELRRRYAEMESGRVQGISAEESLRRVREVLDGEATR